MASLFNEEASIKKFLERVTAVFTKLSISAELLFVSDGTIDLIQEVKACPIYLVNRRLGFNEDTDEAWQPLKI